MAVFADILGLCVKALLSESAEAKPPKVWQEVEGVQEAFRQNVPKFEAHFKGEVNHRSCSSFRVYVAVFLFQETTIAFGSAMGNH